MSVAERVSEDRARFGSHRAHSAGSFALALDDIAAPVGRRRRSGDLGPACTGTIGIAPSANINPEGHFPSLFESVHGSAPDIAGKGVANPIGQIWTAAMMLDHLGHQGASRAIMQAIETTLKNEATRTRDLGGKTDTATCDRAAVAALDQQEGPLLASQDILEKTVSIA